MVFQTNAEIDNDKVSAPYKEGYPKVFHDDGTPSRGNDKLQDDWAFHGVRKEITRVTFNDNVQMQSLQHIFNGCINLVEVNINGFTTAGVASIAQAFRDCNQLTSLDLSGWNVSSVKNMGHMFQGCTNLSSLNISGWSKLQI